MRIDDRVNTTNYKITVERVVILKFGMLPWHPLQQNQLRDGFIWPGDGSKIWGDIIKFTT